MPFVIAFIISTFIEPLIRLLEKRAHIRRRLSSLLSILIFLSTFGVLFFFIISKIISEIKQLALFLQNQPDWLVKLYSDLNNFLSGASKFYIDLPASFTAGIQSTLSNTSKTIFDSISSIATGLINIVASVPQLLIFIIITTISLYFFTSDRETIYNFVKKQLPDKVFSKLENIKNDLFLALFGYIKAYSIIVLITFSELAIGLSLIGIKYSILIALIICFVDLLPIFGSGTVLVPWVIYCFFTGQTLTGILLLILYIIVFIVRQIIEPKIVGKQIGLHPLLTLFAMYVGLQSFGVIGMLLGVITVILLKSILLGVLKGKTISEFIESKSKSKKALPD